MDNFTPDMPEKLVQYLDGELTGAEKINMEQQLAADKTLQNEMDSLKSTREAVKLSGLQQKVADIHVKMMEEMQPPVKKINSTRKILRYSMAVAASLVLLVGGYMAYNFSNLSSSKIFASNYQSFELSNVRDADSQQISSLEKAYRQKKYKEVIELQVQNNIKSVREIFLAAMSYIELENNVRAIDEFKKVITGNKVAQTSLLNDEAEYYLALTYIRNKDFGLALNLLRKIKEDPDHLYYEKVTGKIIRQVKLLKWR